MIRCHREHLNVADAANRFRATVVADHYLSGAIPAGRRLALSHPRRQGSLNRASCTCGSASAVVLSGKQRAVLPSSVVGDASMSPQALVWSWRARRAERVLIQRSRYLKGGDSVRGSASCLFIARLRGRVLSAERLFGEPLLKETRPSTAGETATSRQGPQADSTGTEERSLRPLARRSGTGAVDTSIPRQRRRYERWRATWLVICLPLRVCGGEQRQLGGAMSVASRILGQAHSIAARRVLALFLSDVNALNAERAFWSQVSRVVLNAGVARRETGSQVTTERGVGSMEFPTTQPSSRGGYSREMDTSATCAAGRQGPTRTNCTQGIQQLTTSFR